MSRIRRCSKKAFVPALFVGMVLAIGMSTPSARAQDPPPTCDGMHCHEKADCGSKCNCNRFHHTCVDNTVIK